jgi:small subunit ribosomal protein S6e
MVEFKAVINDAKSGKSYQVPVAGQGANSLIGKKIGDVVDGIFVGLPGYKLMITGGSDKDGFPMRKDLPGPRRKKILVSRGMGFRTKEVGLRKKVSYRGGSISPDTVQLNMKINVVGPQAIDELIKKEETKK